MSEQYTLQIKSKTYLCSSELANLLAIAVKIAGYKKERFDLTFNSTLLAFLISKDPISQWFKIYVNEAKIDFRKAIEERRINERILEKIAADPPSPLSYYPSNPSESANELLEGTAKFSIDLATSDQIPMLQVHHLMAATIYYPGGHFGSLGELGFIQEDWSNAFLGLMKEKYKHELEFWKNVHQKIVKTKQIVNEANLIEGPSTHIAKDLWTVDDELGFKDYAKTIYRFMTNKATEFPLTISIQAPWGGGKTSLMKMIQKNLDPAAFEPLEFGKNRLSLRKALDEINYLVKNPGKNKNLSLENYHFYPTYKDDVHIPTIWFNAWKYASTNQVWAGMADAIISQIAERLPPIEREKFWLNLNIKRIDYGKIRQKMYEQTINYVLHDLLPYIKYVGIALLIFVLTAILGRFYAPLSSAGWYGIILTATVGLLSAGIKFFEAQQKVNDEPASINLGEYLQTPDYRSELGFVHLVASDLERIFETLPGKKLVIFIDDLDRCSPEKVGEVMEGINLFLGGEFLDCMFIIGMDAEMVAAALDSAHEKMIKCLPSDASTPLGWRFMDKFVQLPFVIPPPENINVEQYITSLLSNIENKKQIVDPIVYDMASTLGQEVDSYEQITDKIKSAEGQNKMDEKQIEKLIQLLSEHVFEKHQENYFKTFNDDNKIVHDIIFDTAKDFSHNPRELKRFINAFRLQYFLLYTKLERAHRMGKQISDQEIETNLEQLKRWTVFSMKWPEVVRWVQHGGGRELRIKEDQKDILSPNRLRQLELMGANAKDIEIWFENAKKIAHLNKKYIKWLNDDDLRQFFYDECNGYSEGHRLSDGFRKGLW